MNQPEQAKAVQEVLEKIEHGARRLGGLPERVVFSVCLIWTIFQLWIASPLPYMAAAVIPLLNDTQTRAVHLAFAVFLVFATFAFRRKASRESVSVLDWVLAAVGAFTASYTALFYEQLAMRPGLPTTADLVVAGTGLVLLLEAARRSLGPALTVIAVLCLGYILLGDSAVLPDMLRWKGASVERALSHQWLTTQGIYGIALGISASFVFLFVLFSALLEAAGAGNYFIKLAFALLGRFRGGPAKAAVVGSAMTGLISGSSIANVVAVGTFTIPLMKRTGFSAEKAGAVETASSIDGQLMPPVMGAAAFLMVEYVGIPYAQVIKHAIVPAALSYFGLFCIVHIESLKLGLKPLAVDAEARTWLRRITGFLAGFAGVAATGGAVYFGLGWIKAAAGSYAWVVLSPLLLGAYLYLVRHAARHPDLSLDNPADAVVVPRLSDIAPTGLHFVLPIVVLVWFLIVERASPGLSAFWAVLFMMVVLLTQKPLKALFRRQAGLRGAFLESCGDLVNGLVTGARNMIPIAVATATAGIIVGTVTLTGIGQVMAGFVELISGGQLLLMLIFVAVFSLILGMGIPTTANYIVVSSLMAGVVVQLAAANGLVVPLIAVHMFVFYFGIMADVTPPVGLAAFAAAAVSGGDPLRTGLQGFFYALRTAILPFMFIFNTELLLVDVGWARGLYIFGIGLVAMVCFSAGTLNHFVTRNRWWESLGLLLVTFTLLRPGFWLDLVSPPFRLEPPAAIARVAGELPDGARLRLSVSGEDLGGRMVARTVDLPLGARGDGSEDSGAARLMNAAGLAVLVDDGRVLVDDLMPGGPAERAGLDYDWTVTEVGITRERPPKDLFYLVGFALLLAIVLIQLKRAKNIHR